MGWRGGRQHERLGKKRTEIERKEGETDGIREIKRSKTRQGGSGETPIKALIR